MPSGVSFTRVCFLGPGFYELQKIRRQWSLRFAGPGAAAAADTAGAVAAAAAGRGRQAGGEARAEGAV